MDAARGAAALAARAAYGRLVAHLASRTRDLAAIEDALSGAFVSALERWPAEGVPTRPEAWLLTAARRRLIDAARRERTRRAAWMELAMRAERGAMDAGAGGGIEDERLALLFACAHPAIEASARTALVLSAVMGFTAAEVAAAFLEPVTAVEKRLARAKAKLRDAGVRFEVPPEDERAGRLACVLEAIYAAYGRAFDADASGGDAGASREAVWLARLVVDLLPGEPEAMGLLSMLLHCEARRPARRDAAGDYVPLLDQDLGRWDHAMIDEAESLLEGAFACGVVGRFQLEAAVQSVHAARRRTGRVDWDAAVNLYGALVAMAPSLGARVAWAAALAQRDGAAAGLAALAAIEDGAADGYQPMWAAKAEMLDGLGAPGADVRACAERAVELAADASVRGYLRRRFGL